MDALAEEEPSQRIGYEDFNESLCSKVIVHATLTKLLGVNDKQIQSEDPNLAFRVISVDIGSKAGPHAAESGATSPLSNTHGLDGIDDALYSKERAAALWSSSIIRKTFIERRSWQV